ncbi:unnamed protein product [Rodentolepis nana]|uniref:Uncharacterized protein n=1 Tax=Rodentolepis nana TaxID=102285 RepID=A0A0R3T0C1_RODNA|nr:unnamed protein product [Rodentolepis nana]
MTDIHGDECNTVDCLPSTTAGFGCLGGLPRGFGEVTTAGADDVAVVACRRYFFGFLPLFPGVCTGGATTDNSSLLTSSAVDGDADIPSC